MAYIDDFENEFKKNLLQLKLDISMITDDRIKKSLVKDNIESHIISALTLGARQFIDTYYSCVLKVLNNKVKVEDLKSESIFNKYKNKFRRRFLDLFEDLDVIFWTNGQSNYWDFNPITILRTDLLIKTLIEKNSKINSFNSNYSGLERLPSSKSSDITEFKFTLDILKDDYENSVFSSKMGNNMKINGTIKPEVKGEETKLFATITGFTDSKILNVESVPARETFYKGSGEHNGFLMFEANQFKPTIEKKIFDYLKNDLKVDISESNIKIKIENDVFKNNTFPDNKDINYKLVVINPKEDEKSISGVINFKKEMKSFGLVYNLISSSYIYGYKDNKKIEFKKDVKDLVVKFSPNPDDNTKFIPVDDIEEYEKLLPEIIKNLEINFSSTYNTQIKLKIVRSEADLKDNNISPKNDMIKNDEIKDNNSDQLLIEYSVKVSSEGAVDSKEQPMGLFKKGTKGKIVTAINKCVSISGSEYLKETEKNILSLQKNKKIRVDGIVGDETWIPLFGYDRTLVNGTIKIYSRGSNKYCTGELTIKDKKIELRSDTNVKKVTELTQIEQESKKEEINEIELEIVPGVTYTEGEIKPTAKIMILKNDILKSGYGKIENIKSSIIQFNTPFENSSIDELSNKVISGLNEKLASSFPNFGTIKKKEIVNNDINSDVVNKNNQTNTNSENLDDSETLSNNMLLSLEQEFLKNGITTFLKKIETPIEIILKGDGNFTIFVESPKNDNTSKIGGEINFISTNGSITGMCEIKGLPSNYTNTKTNLVVKTTEYMYSTSQSVDTPESRIALGNEALLFFETKIKSDYDIDIKLALKDKFAEKLEDTSLDSPIISTKFSEMDGEWIFNVEKENSFVNKDFGTLVIIGEPGDLENKYPSGLDPEYMEDSYSGEADIDNTEQYIANQQELFEDLTFEIALENKPYIEKSMQMNSTQPTTTTPPTETTDNSVSNNTSISITPAGSFKLYGGVALERVCQLIYKGESGGDANIFNYPGGKGNKIPKGDVKNKVNISNMTLGELKNYQNSAHPEISASIHATGLFQIIKGTLKEVANRAGISDSTKYDFKTQKILGSNLILGLRRNAGHYINGKNEGTKEDLEKIVHYIGQCWASLPVIYSRKGGGYGSGQKVGDVSNGGGNAGYYGGDGVNPSKVRTEVGTVVLNVIKARIELTGKKPSYIPDYVKNYI